jgi:hypothetical protein
VRRLTAYVLAVAVLLPSTMLGHPITPRRIRLPAAVARTNFGADEQERLGDRSLRPSQPR